MLETSYHDSFAIEDKVRSGCLHCILYFLAPSVLIIFSHKVHFGRYFLLLAYVGCVYLFVPFQGLLMYIQTRACLFRTQS